MIAWFESIVGPEYAPAAMWTTIAVAALLLLIIILRLLRGLSSGTFVMGGRNRKARLAVMDATAVDANRRLVLVRRDDVEHLILIGGPTDVVVEQGIRPPYAPRREEPAAAEQPRAQPPVAAEPASPVRTPVRPVEAPVPAPAPVSAPAAMRQEPVVRSDAPPPMAAPVARPQTAPLAAAPIVPPPVERAAPMAAPAVRAEPTLDAPAAQPHRPGASAGTTRAPAIEPGSLDVHIPAPQPVQPRAEPRTRDADEVSLEEEMSRLLGNVSPSSNR